MKIQVGGLSEGVHEYRFQAEPASLEIGEQFRKDVTVDVALEKIGNQVHLRAEVEAEGEFECDRCVAPFTQRLSSTYRISYVPEGTPHEHLDPAEVQVMPPHFSVINLADDVRQTILLSVPLKLLCSPDCGGLCPHCGTNLNTGSCTCSDEVVDGRWEKLRMLQDRNLQDPR